MSSSRRVRVAPATPTSSSRYVQAPPHTPNRTATVRYVIDLHQFLLKKPLRDDKMFVPFRTALRNVNTLVSFAYKADQCQGKLVPIPYPRNDDGRPVVPSLLIEHVEDRGWKADPNCFCAIRGHSNRFAVLYVPQTSGSPAFGQVCLVCPEYECPYFVNIQELYEYPESCEELLDVEDNAITLPGSSPNKSQVRIPSWEARASGVTPDQFDLLSKLFSRKGIPRGQFDDLFHVCSRCNHVSRVPHGCVTEPEYNSELEDDLERIVAK